MLMTIIKKELLSFMMSSRFALTMICIVFLGFSATVIRTTLYKQQQQDRTQAHSLWASSIDTAKSFQDVMQTGKYIVSPPLNPLAIFSGGISEEISRSITISPNDWEQLELLSRDFNGALFRYALRLDMTTVVAILCSLLALLLMYDSVCGERESGTLKVMLSGPLPRDSIIIGKIIAAQIVICIPLFAAWILSIIYVTLIANVQFTPAQYERIFLLVAFSGLYAGFFGALGMAISAIVNRSSTSLVMALFVWALFVLTIPNIVPLAAQIFSPVPPESTIQREKNMLWFGPWEQDPKAQQQREELGASGKLLSFNQIDSALQAWHQSEVIKQQNEIDQFYQRRFNRQIETGSIASRLSPTSVFYMVSAHLASTGVKDFIKSVRDMGEFEPLVKAFFSSEQREEQNAFEAFSKLPPEVQKNQQPKLSPPRSSDFPVFKPRTIALERVFSNSMLDLTLLCGGLMLCIMIAFIGFLKSEVK